MNNLPVRKNIRLKGYDYSSAGYYFVTMCIKDGHEMLGKIVGETVPGLPQITSGFPQTISDTAPNLTCMEPSELRAEPPEPHIELSELGKCVDSAIKYYSTNNIIVIDKYAIMPNHIHLIIVIKPEPDDQGKSAGERWLFADDRPQSAGDRGRSPLQYIVRNLKSYVTKQTGFSPWQKSFHERIIRNQDEYQRIWRYIDKNPASWTEDEYYQ